MASVAEWLDGIKAGYSKWSQCSEDIRVDDVADIGSGINEQGLAELEVGLRAAGAKTAHVTLIQKATAEYQSGAAEKIRSWNGFSSGWILHRGTRHKKWITAHCFAQENSRRYVVCSRAGRVYGNRWPCFGLSFQGLHDEWLAI